MRRMRENMKRAERERDQAFQMIQELRAKMPAAPEQPREDYSFNLADDDLPSGQHVKKLDKKFDRQYHEMREEFNQYKKQHAQSMAEAKIAARYPDFSEVVTEENATALRESFPELAESIRSNPDMYKQAAAAYTAIKKLGIHQDNPQADYDRVLAQRNATKPRPTASVSPQQGTSPLTKANEYATKEAPSQEMKDKLWKEMNEFRRSY
jgi:hypothetical protein